jgi:hypothetical protein
VLTDTYIKQLKPTPKKYRAYDRNGLFLLVKASGKKMWRVEYKFAGKTKILKGKSYQELNLSAARAWCRQAKFNYKMHLHDRQNFQFQQHNLTADDVTFEYVARDWLSHARRHLSAKYALRIQQNFEKDIFPALGHIPIELVDGPSLRTVLKKVEERGAIEVCRRLRSQCSCVFSFAIAEGKARFDPSISIIGALPKRNNNAHRSALKASRVPALFSALSNGNVKSITLFSIQWTIINMVRASETRLARYDEFEEIDGDLPIWRIPPERVKTGIAHIVPLSKQSVQLLSQIKNLGLRSEYLFPSDATQEGVIGHSRMLVD